MTEQPSQAGQEPPEGTNAPIPAAPAKGGLGTGAKVGLLVAGAVALVAISGIGGYAIGQSIGSSKEHATSHWQPWELGELWRPDKDHRHHKSGPHHKDHRHHKSGRHHKDHRDGYQDDWNDGQGMGPDQSGPGWDAPPTPEGPAGPPEPGPSPQS